LGLRKLGEKVGVGDGGFGGGGGLLRMGFEVLEGFGGSLCKLLNEEG
jgi:hypothetical protein